ncbi:MAG: YjjG family noncanonical pyrimidine nucleotidase [Flammeovirgaceae bacterium]|nr:YjjG family noncanonical pyrimidine nucleotidase [Flammeovirgaceae bacterium]
MKKYACIFFDLDHTLWDYETNSKLTLRELFDTFDLERRGVTSFDAFLDRFKEVNTRLWVLYDAGQIGSEVIRKERFRQILEAFGAYEEDLSQVLSKEYLYSCPKKNVLIPHAEETLEYLSGKYTMSVITNGFEEIQHSKLTAGNLHRFFKHIITSQQAGHKKPAKEIFQFTLSKNLIDPRQAIMVGDNLMTDIAGARNAAIDSVFYNPDKNEHQEEVTHEIESLKELCRIL